jgi:hypothetical protein
MENNPDQQFKDLSEEEKLAQAERALELEQLEDREFQGTHRNDQASI